MQGDDQQPRAYAPSRLTIDLDALVSNYSFLSKKSGAVECAAVVKADAYGLGVAPVANALNIAGCRTFFVATLDEAIELRRLIDHPIYVFNGVTAHEAEAFEAHRIIPVLNDAQQIENWRHHLKNRPALPCAVHIDTGMNRLGLPYSTLESPDALQRQIDGLSVSLLMSHLACADESDHQMNQDQLHRFQKVTNFAPHVPASLSASSGLLLGAEWHFDLVRPGIALYGGNPHPAMPNPLSPVIKLSARILQCRAVRNGESVGYSATHKFTKPKQIATLAIGYADGFFRSLSGRGTVFFGKKSLPVLGRVSMDLIAVDITGIDGVKAGDWVDIIGPYQDVDALAVDAGTIGYEVLTALGHRHQRDYVGACA